MEIPLEEVEKFHSWTHSNPIWREERQARWNDRGRGASEKRKNH